MRLYSERLEKDFGVPLIGNSAMETEKMAELSTPIMLGAVTSNRRVTSMCGLRTNLSRCYRQGVLKRPSIHKQTHAHSKSNITQVRGVYN